MKKILLLILVGIAGVFTAVRITAINKNIHYSEIREYSMHEEVPISENIFMDSFENMDGYSVTVNEAEIYTYDEFLEKFNYDENTRGVLCERSSMSFPEMVCNLNVTVRNNNSEAEDSKDKFMDFKHYTLYSIDFLLQISSPLYVIANPDLEDGMTAFRLRPESEMDFNLPFYFTPSGKAEPLQIEDVLNGGLYLPVSMYPEQRQILIEDIKHH